MKFKWMYVMCAVLSAVSLGTASTARADDAPALKIAICNPVKVATQIQEYKDLNEKLKSEKTALDVEMGQRKEKIKSMQDELKLLVPDSVPFGDKNKALLQYSIETEVWAKMQEMDLSRTQKNMTKSIFDKIAKTVAQLAKDRAITLVLADKTPDIPDDLDNVPAETLTMALLQKSVLYSDPKYDITQDVVIAMDKAYNASH
jgi:Skp family chaperone for outer membrane proteins